MSQDMNGYTIPEIALPNKPRKRMARVRVPITELTLGERSVLLRYRMGISRSELAKLLSVSRQTIWRLERGLRMSVNTEYRFELAEQRAGQRWAERTRDRDKAKDPIPE